MSLRGPSFRSHFEIPSLAIWAARSSIRACSRSIISMISSWVTAQVQMPRQTVASSPFPSMKPPSSSSGWTTARAIRARVDQLLPDPEAPPTSRRSLRGTSTSSPVTVSSQSVVMSGCQNMSSSSVMYRVRTANSTFEDRPPGERSLRCSSSTSSMARMAWCLARSSLIMSRPSSLRTATTPDSVSLAESRFTPRRPRALAWGSQYSGVRRSRRRSSSSVATSTGHLHDRVERRVQAEREHHALLLVDDDEDPERRHERARLPGLPQGDLRGARPHGDHRARLGHAELDHGVHRREGQSAVTVERVVRQRPALAPHGNGVVETHRFLLPLLQRRRPDLVDRQVRPSRGVLLGQAEATGLP